MKNHETACERYRREEAELAQRLDEQRHAVEEAETLERARQSMRENGTLDKVEAGLRRFRSSDIRLQRRRGKSLRDARQHADGVIARVWKTILENRVSSPACPGNDPAE
jgi:hypothetical protein